MNIEELRKKLKDYQNSPKYQENIEKAKRWSIRKKEYTESMRNLLEYDPTFLEQLLEREERFQNFKYHKHNICTSSRLFNIAFNLWLKYGEPTKEEDNDFLAGSFLWLGYKMQLFVGQGSFYRVYKGEDIIFQST